MYDFTIQKQMLDVTLDLLKENNLLEVSTLGGGTALAAYYFNHRYSTDIDIFIYAKENKTHLLKPSNFSIIPSILKFKLLSVRIGIPWSKRNFSELPTLL